MATTSLDADKRAPRTSENDYDGLRPGRARVSQACTRCRARKDRCDGKQPQCSNCSNANQHCLYVAGNKKRGLPEGYVRGLEKLWAVMIQKVRGLDDTVRRVIEENEDELVRVWNHHKYGDDLHMAWKESRVLSELEKLLARLEQRPQADLKRKREREEDGGTASPLQSTPGDVYTLPPNFRVTTTPNVETGIVIDQSEPTPNTCRKTSSPAPESIPLPRTTSGLMDHYFKYTHCWFPILDKPYTLKKYYEYTRSHKGVPPLSSDLAYIWAMCAYTKQQTLFVTDPNIASEGPTVAEMRKIARNLIPTESGPFFLGHVQALLLLALLDLGNAKTSSAWILVGFAVRALLSGTDVAGDRHPRRTAVLQGCFILDTLISMQLRKPPHLQAEHLVHTPLLNEDGYEEWEPCEAPLRQTPGPGPPGFVISCFNRLTELCMFANSSLKTELCQSSPETGSIQAYSNTPGLQALAERYPFEIMQMEPRPPHQMLLQACHFVVIATASALSNTVREGATRKFLENLGLFEHTWNASDRCGVPSILTTLCRLIKLSPGHHLLPDGLDQTVARLAPIWANFMPATTSAEHQSDPKLVSLEDTGSRSATMIPAKSIQQVPHTEGFTSSPSGVWYRESSSYQRNQLSHIETAEEQYQPKSTQYVGRPAFAGSSEHTSQMPATSIDYGTVNIGVPHHSFEAVLQTNSGTANPDTTSPDFEGDEIDALFHEMAQLDTTQWAMDRTQGLRDFGFADNSTFEAFCNDPDRLMLSEGYIDPTVHNNNGGDYGTQTAPPGSDDRQESSLAPPRSTFEDFGGPW